MQIKRRDFVKVIGASAAALGLSGLELRQVEEALAAPGQPPVIWLSGSACTGCSVSFLNAFTPNGTTNLTAADVLTKSVDLQYHSTIMASAGDLAVARATSTAQAGGYILIVEGAIPTAAGGKYAYVWDEVDATGNRRSVTMAEAVKALAANAKYVLAVGTCAAFGGIPAVNTSTGSMGVGDYLRQSGMSLPYLNQFPMGMINPPTGPALVNLPGCAPHPDWMIGSIAKLLAGAPLPLDMFGRPTEYYTMQPLHHRCPRRMKPQATQFGQDGLCVIQLGCKGPIANADCVTRFWNNKQDWCIGANGLCLACVQPDFPAFPFHSKNTHMLMGMG